MAQLFASEFLIFYTDTDALKPACNIIFSSLCILSRGLDHRVKCADHLSDPSGDKGWHGYNRQEMGLNQDLKGGEANIPESLCTQNVFLGVQNRTFHSPRVTPCCKGGGEEQRL